MILTTASSIWFFPTALTLAFRELLFSLFPLPFPFAAAAFAACFSPLTAGLAITVFPNVLSSRSNSNSVKISHAFRNGAGVLLSPIPITMRPLSRRRLASFVKSLSLDTRQNPSSSLVYSMSIASMIIAESVAFFPCV